MTRTEILKGYIEAEVPGLTGYAYQATTWCASHGRRIAKQIVRYWDVAGLLPQITHDDLCNTDRFPVPMRFEACDYCDRCGKKGGAR